MRSSLYGKFYITQKEQSLIKADLMIDYYYTNRVKLKQKLCSNMNINKKGHEDITTM